MEVWLCTCDLFVSMVIDFVEQKWMSATFVFFTRGGYFLLGEPNVLLERCYSSHDWLLFICCTGSALWISWTYLKDWFLVYDWFVSCNINESLSCCFLLLGFVKLLPSSLSLSLYLFREVRLLIYEPCFPNT